MTTPYAKGYEAGLENRRYINPYTRYDQCSEWDAGYCAGEIERKVGGSDRSPVVISEKLS